MGIKKFFGWCKNRFADNIYRLERGEVLEDIQNEFNESIQIDNCMIDMNGLFHSSAQKAFEYGEHKSIKRLVSSNVPKPSFQSRQQKMFEDICRTIDSVIHILKPRKRLILCVDGIAPFAKQQQQRQRRFVSAMHNSECMFDSNSLTPGTKFMDHLTKYIDWYIRKELSNPNSAWSNLEVIFSNEKASGEGEHKLLSYLRRYGNKEETYCIHGMDADLIMLVLASHTENFYILREDMMESNSYFFIDMKNYRKDLTEMMRWSEEKHTYNPRLAVNDFVFMCFTVGNDFLPHIPGMEIVEGGIDMMLDVYRQTCRSYGHLTDDKSRFCPSSVRVFLGTLSQYEKGVLENKLLHKESFFEDELLERCATFENRTYNLDICLYRDEYYKQNLPNCDLQQLCHDYLEGMQWVLSYYTQGVSNWSWKYPYHYAPFAHTIAEYISSFQFKHYGKTLPALPFVQLLSVLPPKSSHLLPPPLNSLLVNSDSPLHPYCPRDFDIDVSGKMNDWEGVVLLPIIDGSVVEKSYQTLINQVDERDKKRNVIGKSFVYKTGRYNQIFRSVYGDIQTCVETKPIDL